VSYPLICVHCGTVNLPQAIVCIECRQPPKPKPRGIVVSNSTGSLPIHSVLNQRYQIIGQVGMGGMGAVYKAQDTKLGNRLVAIKEMSQNDLSAREIAFATNAFKQEAHMLAGLHHPNLPSIHDYFNQSGRSYLVMSFIEGETLEHYLQATNNVYLTIKEVLDIGIQLCTALDFLHTRQPPIIFRDLKPSNIMRTPDGHIYLIDFGIVRLFKPGQTWDTNALGTLGYAAPEQHGKTQTTPRADIYSLGATLHYLLSGNDPVNTPFRFSPLQFQDQPELLDLEMLIMQMVDMDESKRPGSIAAIKQELQRIATQEGEYKANLYRNPSTSPTGVIRSTRAATTPFQFTTAPEQVTTVSSHPGASTFSTYTFRSFWPINAIAWSPDGRLIASASTIVQLWEAANGNIVFTYRGHSRTVNTLAWSPAKTTSTPERGFRIASCSDDKTVQVWNAATGNNITTYTGHGNVLRGGSVKAIAWSPDGTLIASAGHDRTIQVWHVSTGGSVYTYQGHAHWLKGGSINTLAWSPDGKFIASGSDDKSLQVWKASSGAYVFTYRGNSAEVHTIAWSPDSKRIASGDNAGRVRIWDIDLGNYIFTYSAHTAAVRSIGWSPDGQYIASAGDDQTVQVWDALSGDKVITYSQHTAAVKAVAWSPNSQLIASASNDNTVQIWQPL
jgi:eukaryotic-like serine/threonine-protein kinase